MTERKSQTMSRQEAGRKGAAVRWGKVYKEPGHSKSSAKTSTSARGATAKKHTASEKNYRTTASKQDAGRRASQPTSRQPRERSEEIPLRSHRSTAARQPREHFEEMNHRSSRSNTARHPYEHFEEMNPLRSRSNATRQPHDDFEAIDRRRSRSSAARHPREHFEEMDRRSSRSNMARHPYEHFEEIDHRSSRSHAAHHPREYFEEMERRDMREHRHPHENGYGRAHYREYDDDYASGQYYGRFPHYDEEPRRHSLTASNRQPAKRQSASHAGRTNTTHQSREFYQEIGRKGGQARRKG